MSRKRRPQVGARPGTLVLPEGAEPTRLSTVYYHGDQLEENDHASIADVRRLIKREGITWIDVNGFGDASILSELAKLFQISPLAMEDVVNVPQRPKVQSFAQHEVLITRPVELMSSGKTQLNQLSLIIGLNFVITFHQGGETSLQPVRQRLRRAGARMHTSAVDYLAYAIVDTVVDGYFPTLEWFGERIEALEHHVLERPRPELLRQIHEIRTQLIQLRRCAWPQREAIEAIVAHQGQFISPNVREYLRDTVDHCIQIVDMVESYRESTSSLINMHMSVVAHRSNEIMRVLTIMSSVFVPLTFIAGIYGMNFDNMPELRQPLAYPVALLVMVLTAMGMLGFFYRRGWLGNNAVELASEADAATERVPRPAVVVLDHDQATDRAAERAA